MATAIDVGMVGTIVSLVYSFIQGSRNKKLLTHKEFMEWLEYHRHEEIKEVIFNTYQLQHEIDLILRTEHSEIIDMVNRSNNLLVEVLGRLDSFAPLTHRLVPSLSLSEQAISILRQLVNSGYKEVGLYKSNSGSSLVVGGYKTAKNQLTISDQRFLEDDLDSLVKLQLFRLRLSSRGDAYYGITRRGVQFLNTVTKAMTNRDS